jgi:hypothetical protein
MYHIRQSEINDHKGYLKVAGLFFSIKKCPSHAKSKMPSSRSYKKERPETTRTHFTIEKIKLIKQKCGHRQQQQLLQLLGG